ncbi:tRNA (adenine(22)-N(1))-methyltransferase [Robertmurraya kyonggiensis]|uniref:tRNA (Adenine-N(1))-methyltransferase n=1 Tax=Robertmurraya kyonggiensis TaxID=1037680 RepID=A0A4U1DCJ2_9BACI|nr:tRNA (adenine(22)-N(1))-methyltransferase TrmK [Robertmurraya kyonggiensis]TKC19938.1 tRNA (adenine-N(1))-methyltransferase [Robertmurraya kyonggiensis]
MNIDKLSQRLQSVAGYIPEGSSIADIGSDHAYLPCHVVKKGRVPFAIAGEVVEGPFQSAKKQVESEELTNQIDVRKGDGLAVLSPGEVDCITIAGMGGALIASILEQGLDKLEGVTRLILQPNLSAQSIRVWLIDHEWQLIAEEILEEDGKIYEILVAEKGEPHRPYNQEKIHSELLMGPFLSSKKTEPFVKKWKSEMKNWMRILSKLEQAADTEDNRQKKEELQNKLRMVEEVLD